MSGFDRIDLSKLDSPTIIQPIDFEILFAEMKARAIAVMPELEVFLQLESEPVTKLLQLFAYFRALDLARFNDEARSTMLAFASGSDLDHIGAGFGVARLIVQQADATIDPPIIEELEADEDFRSRIQLSLEGRTTAGSRGSYVFHALSASGDVKDVSVTNPAPGDVLVTVLSKSGNGQADQQLLDQVDETLSDEDVRDLTARVTVQSATILTYTIDATLVFFEGPDAAAVLAAAEAAVAELVVEQHRLGHDITLSSIYAALHQPGVQRVELAAPLANIVVDANEAAFCDPAPVISTGGVDV